MKRTGIKKLELKRLTVKQLTDVTGAGCAVVTRFCSDTCTCTTTQICFEFQAVNGYNQCDNPACGGACLQAQSQGCCGGGCGGGGGHYENMCMV